MKSARTEILTNGFIDVQNNGQMNASARLIRIHIGEPNKFSLPISIYSGVTGNGFKNTILPNEQLIVNIANPLGGLFNVSFDGSQQIPRKNLKPTKLLFLFQAGQRLLNVTDMATFQSTTFSNLFLNSGVLFQTSAWEKNKIENIGVLQIATRLLNIQSNQVLNNYLAVTSGIRQIWAISITFGLEIEKLVSIRFAMYKYLSTAIPSREQPIYQLSMNYELR